MSRQDLARSITRHATSKLPSDDLLNINFMGFRGEALPSIASVSDMTIDTCNGMDENGWVLDCATGEIKPSDWDAGTRIRVKNLFSKTPARLKFLRGDRAEMMSVLDVVKRLAMARPDVGFTLNNKWRFPKNQDMDERIIAVMGDDVRGRMLAVDSMSVSGAGMTLRGFISEPTLRRASSIDQFLFVNGRPVKDKVLVGALRAAYMDVMHAREFPLCALYLELEPRCVDVNVSPAKTEVHFLEPAHVRAFIIKSLRDALAQTLSARVGVQGVNNVVAPVYSHAQVHKSTAPVANAVNFSSHEFRVASPQRCGPDMAFMFGGERDKELQPSQNTVSSTVDGGDVERPLGRVIGQIGNKYILAQSGENLVIIDQHAAHERITYERLRQHAIKSQPLLTPIVVALRAEDANAVLSIADEMQKSGLHVGAFGDDAVAVFEKPADWDLNWRDLFHSIADEVRMTSSDPSEQMKIVHDYLLRTTTYTNRGGNDGYDEESDAFFSGLANCSGYSRAYSMILRELEIPVLYVSSSTMDHAWNMGYDGMNYWYIDASLDDVSKKNKDDYIPTDRDYFYERHELDLGESDQGYVKRMQNLYHLQ